MKSRNGISAHVKEILFNSHPSLEIVHKQKTNALRLDKHYIIKLCVLS